MKTFGLKITEDELKALIRYHANKISYSVHSPAGLDHTNYDIETSQRIHDLTKRLNKETPEIEGDIGPQEKDVSAKSTGW